MPLTHAPVSDSISPAFLLLRQGHGLSAQSIHQCRTIHCSGTSLQADTRCRSHLQKARTGYHAAVRKSPSHQKAVPCMPPQPYSVYNRVLIRLSRFPGRTACIREENRPPVPIPFSRQNSKHRSGSTWLRPLRESRTCVPVCCIRRTAQDLQASSMSLRIRK